jgi:hypothetical protein
MAGAAGQRAVQVGASLWEQAPRCAAGGHWRFAHRGDRIRD